MHDEERMTHNLRDQLYGELDDDDTITGLQDRATEMILELGPCGAIDLLAAAMYVLGDDTSVAPSDWRRLNTIADQLSDLVKTHIVRRSASDSVQPSRSNTETPGC